MKKALIFITIVLSIFSIVLTSCAPATNMAGSWQNAEYEKKEIKKILVLGIARNAWGQKAFEYTLRDELIEYGLDAVATTDHIPHDEKIKEGTFDKYFAEQNIDAVLVSRIVAVDEKTTAVYNSMYTIPYGYYNGFNTFYFAAYDYVYNPGYSYTEETVRIETNFYDAKDKSLIWSGISESVDPDDAFELIDDVTVLIVRELDDKGLIQSK